MRDGGDSDDARVDFLAQRLLARPLSAEERSVVASSLASLLNHYREQPEDAKKLIATGESQPDEKLAAAALAGWTMLANQLMNLDEVLNK